MDSVSKLYYLLNWSVTVVPLLRSHFLPIQLSRGADDVEGWCNGRYGSLFPAGETLRVIMFTIDELQNDLLLVLVAVGGALVP